MKRLSFVLSIVCLWAGHSVFAQEPAEPAPATLAEPTLPEVLVRPDQQPSDAFPPSAEPSGPNDQTSTYPGLSEQVFGKGDITGLNSITRSEKSVFDTPSLGTIVTREKLNQQQAADMFQALQNEVGVLMQSTARGQSSPFMRGLTGQQVLILVDGIRMNNSVFRAGPNQYFNLIDPGQVERIEVVRGPESVLWGSDAIGGVINVVTRSASQNRGNYGGGGFKEYFSTADVASYSRANIEGWIDQGGVFGGGSYMNVNDLSRGGGQGVQPYTHYGQYAGDIKFNRMIDDESMLTVAMQHFEQQDVLRSDRFMPFVLGPPKSESRPTWFDPQQRDLGYIRLQGLADNRLFDAYTATVSYAKNKEGSQEIRSTTRTDVGAFDIDTIGATVALARDLDPLGRLTYGVDFYYDGIKSYRNRVNPITQAVTPDNPQFPDGSHYQRVGTFLNWDVDLTEQWNASAGVRYEDDDAAGTVNAVSGTPVPFGKTYQGWVSTAGLVYKVNSVFNIVGNISEGFRAPNLDDLSADNPALQDARDIPSLDVRPERARTYEIGLKLDTPKLRMQIFEYWTDLRDNILRQAVDSKGNPVPNKIGPYGTVIPGSSNFIRANFDSYINGTELAAEYLLQEEWSVYGNFWYTYGQDIVRDEPLSRIPPMQGLMGLRWEASQHRKWFDVYTNLVARQDRYNPQNNIDSRFPLGGNPAYATLNLRTGTTLGKHYQHRLSFGLDNITNTPYRVLGSGVDGAGINAIFGYEWSR